MGERPEKHGKSLKKLSLLAGHWNRKIVINSVVHPSKSSTKKLKERLNDLKMPSFCIIVSSANTGLLTVCTIAQEA